MLEESYDGQNEAGNMRHLQEATKLGGARAHQLVAHHKDNELGVRLQCLRTRSEMKGSIKDAYTSVGILHAVYDQGVRRHLLPLGLKLMGGLQADHDPSLPQAGMAERFCERALLTPKVSFVLAPAQRPEFGPERPKGTRNKPKQVQTMVQKPRAKTKA